MSTYENLAKRIYELRQRAERIQSASGTFQEERLLCALNYRMEALLLATLTSEPGLWDTGEYEGDRPIRSFDPVDGAALFPVPPPPDLAA